MQKRTDSHLVNPSDALELKPYTVLGIYSDTGQIFCHHVVADTDMAAFKAVAEQFSTAEFVAAIPGHLYEGHNTVIFPGESVVDADTVCDQEDVFSGDGQVLDDNPHLDNLNRFLANTNLQQMAVDAACCYSYESEIDTLRGMLVDAILHVPPHALPSLAKTFADKHPAFSLDEWIKQSTTQPTSPEYDQPQIG